MSTNVEERRQAYARHVQTDSGIDGMTLGLAELDQHTRGVRPGELAALAAYTKTGKTFMLALATVAARRAGYTPLLMTLEQDIEEMSHRIDALASGVSYTHIEEHRMSAEENRILYEAQDALAGLGPLLVEKPQRGERTVRNMVNRCRQVGADFLLVDQLSWIDADKEYRGERILTQKHGDLVYELKDEINRESVGKIPCALAVQLNRDTVRERAAGGRGGLHNFAHSSMIEQTCDLALGLWRNVEMRANSTMGLDIMGSRRCDLKSWLLVWLLGSRTEISVREEMASL
jgi:replicative DNA helicase